MRISIGCDNAAFQLKEEIKEFLNSLSFEVVDVGIKEPSDITAYPEIAERVAELIVRGECQRGILLCGTGIGMCIAANKVPGIYAAVCHDPFSAERARKSNNAQIIAMGARVIAPHLAKSILKTWLESEFTPGPSSEKIELVAKLEQKYIK